MALNNPYKRAKPYEGLPSEKVIGTHSGTFQCDEAMGVWLLRQLPEYRNSKVVRSRDKDTLAPLDIVIDVGGIYDHSIKRYDHHQREFDERFTEDGVTKLSASGLVYRHYGKDVIRELYPALSDEHLEYVYLKMYESFMQAIDAIDTGVEVAPEVKFRDNTGLSSRVGRMNPRWNEENTPEIADAKFEEASKLCGEDFISVLSGIVESQIPAFELVEEALLKRYDVDDSGEIMMFPSGGMPWKQHLYELEKKHSAEPLVKYVLYTDQAGMWRIQAVTEEGFAFKNRLSLPEKWRGVRDDDLAKIAGIEGCTFCHAAGFIGGNKSYEGVLQMARVALKEGKN
eukprot:CAMPEP_0196812036 /NCGR_PEP_ID=MMETSP1362-20130617/20198_1 /TAXON_ID=163516 /ORGANISM="Leptocylindrus danicus, Strain CCMP1856" /LENGTH=340 /DNA_ID=CAMNT_0042187451 /DNA_START=33 /DNA_END=1055 /DNA_ORIENTATION=-